jgi:hypothetical protein
MQAAQDLVVPGAPCHTFADLWEQWMAGPRRTPAYDCPWLHEILYRQMKADIRARAGTDSPFTGLTTEQRTELYSLALYYTGLAENLPQSWGTAGDQDAGSMPFYYLRHDTNSHPSAFSALLAIAGMLGLDAMATDDALAPLEAFARVLDGFCYPSNVGSWVYGIAHWVTYYVSSMSFVVRHELDDNVDAARTERIASTLFPLIQMLLASRTRVGTVVSETFGILAHLAPEATLEAVRALLISVVGAPQMVAPLHSCLRECVWLCVTRDPELLSRCLHHAVETFDANDGPRAGAAINFFVALAVAYDSAARETVDDVLTDDMLFLDEALVSIVKEVSAATSDMEAASVGGRVASRSSGRASYQTAVRYLVRRCASRGDPHAADLLHFATQSSVAYSAPEATNDVLGAVVSAIPLDDQQVWAKLGRAIFGTADVTAWPGIVADDTVSTVVRRLGLVIAAVAGIAASDRAYTEASRSFLVACGPVWRVVLSRNNDGSEMHSRAERGLRIACRALQDMRVGRATLAAGTLRQRDLFVAEHCIRPTWLPPGPDERSALEALVRGLTDVPELHESLRLASALATALDNGDELATSFVPRVVEATRKGRKTEELELTTATLLQSIAAAMARTNVFVLDGGLCSVRGAIVDALGRDTVPRAWLPVAEVDSLVRAQAVSWRRALVTLRRAYDESALDDLAHMAVVSSYSSVRKRAQNALKRRLTSSPDFAIRAVQLAVDALQDEQQAVGALYTLSMSFMTDVVAASATLSTHVLDRGMALLPLRATLPRRVYYLIAGGLLTSSWLTANAEPLVAWSLGVLQSTAVLGWRMRGIALSLVVRYGDGGDEQVRQVVLDAAAGSDAVLRHLALAALPKVLDGPGVDLAYATKLFSWRHVDAEGVLPASGTADARALAAQRRTAWTSRVNSAEVLRRATRGVLQGGTLDRDEGVQGVVLALGQGTRAVSIGGLQAWLQRPRARWIMSRVDRSWFAGFAADAWAAVARALPVEDAVALVRTELASLLGGGERSAAAAGVVAWYELAAGALSVPAVANVLGTQQVLEEALPLLVRFPELSPSAAATSAYVLRHQAVWSGDRWSGVLRGPDATANLRLALVPYSTAASLPDTQWSDLLALACSHARSTSPLHTRQLAGSVLALLAENEGADRVLGRVEEELADLSLDALLVFGLRLSQAWAVDDAVLVRLAEGGYVRHLVRSLDDRTISSDMNNQVLAVLVRLALRCTALAPVLMEVYGETRDWRARSVTLVPLQWLVFAHSMESGADELRTSVASHLVRVVVRDASPEVQVAAAGALTATCSGMAEEAVVRVARKFGTVLGVSVSGTDGTGARKRKKKDEAEAKYTETERTGAVQGLGALLRSFPYSVKDFTPGVLAALVQVSLGSSSDKLSTAARACCLEFWRTHADGFAERHEDKFASHGTLLEQLREVVTAGVAYYC